MSVRRLVSAVILLVLFFPCAASAQIPGVEDGDLFVGGATAPVGPWSDTTGAIYRIRGGTAVRFCESGAGADFWNVPYEVVVDSKGRVVFLASLGSRFFAGQNIGMLRCGAIGAPAEKLAVFRTGSGVPPDYPEPFRGTQFWSVKGLHVAPYRTVKSDDKIKKGLPHIVNEDFYGLGVAAGWYGNGNPSSPYAHWRLHAETLEWEQGPPIVNTGNNTRLDMHYSGGNTYSASENLLARYSEPLRVDVRVVIGDFEVRGRLSFGAMMKELPVPIVVDDLAAPNPLATCNTDFGPWFEVPAEYGGYRPLSGLHNVVFDALGGNGLVLTSDFVGNHPVSTNVAENLLNQLPDDDKQAYFRHPSFGCAEAPFLGYVPVPGLTTYLRTDTNSLVATPRGLVGVVGGEVVRIAPNSVQTIATPADVPWVGGLSAYPPSASPARTISLVVRIDSPVTVLVTAPDGRRVGIDPQTGAAVNDFGHEGHVGEPGEPRWFAILNPPPGRYEVQTTATGNGPYTAHVYSIDLSKDEGEHISTSGTAVLGASTEHEFQLASDGSVSGDGFSGGETPDTTPPTFVFVPPDIVAGNEVDQCRATAPTLQEPVATDLVSAVTVTGTRSDGRPLSDAFSVGVTTITWTATDAAGNRASLTQKVTIEDRQGPAITAASLSHSVLWPPNQKMVEVSVYYSATDQCDGASVMRSLAVTSNEPVNDTGDGDSAPDWEIIDANRIRLRAERSATGTGRVYTVTITAKDSKGNSTARALTCSVPHNR